MAITDLISRLSGDADSDDLPGLDDVTAPDDLSGLDDTADEPQLTRDPKPARRKAARGGGGAAGARVTAAQRRQVRDAWLMLLTPAAGLWRMRDPHCGGALWDQRTEIADALVPIIARNPAWLRFFISDDAAVLHYVALAAALYPVGEKVFRHHVRHQDPDGGGEGAPVDYSAYTA